MENYLDLINDYFKVKNDLICFNSYSNDVRLFRNHIIKTFNSRQRLENCVAGLQIMANTSINVPIIQFISTEKNVVVENYIDGIVLNENRVQLTTKILFEIGKLMANFHNVNISSQDNTEEWKVTILSDMLKIRESLLMYEEDFIGSIEFVECESKHIFENLHFTYVHGDFKPSNIIFCQTEEKYYLVDFENFMIGDSTLDIYKMLSILKANANYNFKDITAFLEGYSKVKALPNELVKKWIFYDVYYSLRSVRRAINDNTFRNSDDRYIRNADKSAQMKNPSTFIMKNWLEEYLNNSQ